ncbi:MAG: thioredoxin domain-containing protein [Gemmatimonadetes bacterium]|nr:thioredoxin domain-containing protein [Gemmatimonadota bacterium]MYA64613.1 thioredoxin domain-containing protein [Gemmatimonadota bacterium]MYB97363.1 thioredoxin domain-containing protein [Gemmatimonadota bacterium]MYH54349.1 thioredoxin domain-containing protein [Gemmatimonadota bacterium]MYK66356.1 thioredoxin domain-containing protein [Gemmatimonadota bacterium]
MPNRLASETSPYLLQHAHNPVDWYPWCDEALALAREQDRPILLSIGYSACHWCHVMERESFEDDETAALMNRSFVNIKVDREERPDVDSIYMRAVQAMTGHGGWPLTAFLTPAGVPYYGGTYFPPEPRHGMPSFRHVLAAAANAYHSRRDEVARAGAQLTEVLNRSATEPQPASGPFDLSDGRLFAHAVSAAGRTFDPTHGGFGGAPKFPQPDFLDFLLRTGGPESHGVSMASHTLSRMAAGGIRDHAGGGFHRYSVDARWLVPHFEKMLYDNALIARALIRAHLLGARHLGAVAEETLDYVLEDLTSPEGVFYSARDADSEGEEGLFYLWTPAEVAAVLGRDEARLVSRVYDVSEAGNFEGRNILHLPHDLDAVARQEGIGRDELDGRLRDSLAALKDHRAARPAPLRDEKVLTSWNGFTIRALAEAGPALGRSDYTAAGARAAAFLLETVRRRDRLLRVFAAGRAHIDGFLEDYGALGNACLSLYEATLDPRWLTEAARIADATVAHFWSPTEKLFHDAPADGEALVVRPRDIMDNATPSGNSLAVELLVRLAAITGSAAHGEIAEAVFARERGTMERYPSAVGRLLTAAVQHAAPRLEVTLVGSPPSLSGMLDVAHRHPHPNRVIAGGDPEDPAIAALPAMEGRLDRAGQAFVCVGTTCQEPVSTPQALDAALARAQSVSPAG